MKINIVFKAIITALIAIAAILAYIIVGPWVMLYAGISLSSNPPTPEITYGEFPFRLEYEINGEQGHLNL
jgi:hypothetical protein